ncbi:hypothetical protein Forpe1208_v017172 [Fusarium oxysporum f. sp. rapae]|uniref:DUF6570 domain-containing protein n=1 Tax=Fusarium oxysporum f. sp. rapae TaxID=485398 RepID=A0A8J5NFB7_FUSOX|nr:hypothetical protein Forpe1208_v017172 [Fusarium oxysporum f. sp. rapae]
METESLSDLFRRLDARNRENVALAGLGIRTSADIFEATQNQTVERQERSESEQVQDLANVLGVLEEDFAEKERLSDDQTWCTPVSHERKVKTVEEFYKAFHDVRTLPILTCMFCYRKHSRDELEYVEWDWWARIAIEKRDGSPFKLRETPRERCLISSSAAAHATGMRTHVSRRAEGSHAGRGEVDALNSCYGFITKYNIPDGHRQSARYPKHIKGHITVFPNNVQELVTNVLPHPLLKVLDEIHVSWQGSKKPVPSDLSALLSVRRRVVEKALLWLKRHNPLYAEININTTELSSWDSPSHGVPFQVYDRLERNEPSAREKAQTGQLVPPTERGLDDEGSVDIREVLATLGQGHDLEASDEVTTEPSNADGDKNRRDRPRDQLFWDVRPRWGAGRRRVGEAAIRS